MGIKDLRGNPKPRVSPDRTGPKPVQDRGKFLRIFSGRVGSGNFISGRSGSGIFFYLGMEHFSQDFGDKLTLNEKMPFIPKLSKKNGYYP